MDEAEHLRTPQDSKSTFKKNEKKAAPRMEQACKNKSKRRRRVVSLHLRAAKLMFLKFELHSGAECSESTEDLWSLPPPTPPHDSRSLCLRWRFCGGATKSGLQLLSTSVLPFSFRSPLAPSLPLSPAITVKVRLRCLPWEPSPRCVTAM